MCSKIVLLVGLFAVQSSALAFNSSAPERIYWADADAERIQYSNLDGTGLVNLITTGLDRPVDIELDHLHQRMYWSNEDFGIETSNFDGSGRSTFLATIYPEDLEVDPVGGKLYWASAFGGIKRINLDGSNLEAVTNGGDTRGFHLDIPNGKIYWADRHFNKIQRANLDGTDLEDLVTTGLENPMDVVVDAPGGKMYWTDFGVAETPDIVTNGRIQRSNIDGTSVETIVPIGTVLRPVGIALDEFTDQLYWIDIEADKIQRSNLDGSSIETVVSQSMAGFASPHFLSLEPVPVPEPAGFLLLLLTTGMAYGMRGAMRE